ncbi:probable serine/threonine-protein kinase PBL3 isoform X2 [Chenopodium quinoa]|uniref:probable serine/threonine-protein kinase PBL3 isoform X2 n=1 Tax=Chenopodium quinoa TaxID=63459 RepID=UPI000B78FA1C|nr:probable serine/threonine-protein kinase PBL3 isoform X2 [Chenopodium quinoa]
MGNCLGFSVLYSPTIVECSSPNLPSTGLTAFSSDDLLTITEHYRHIHLIGYENFPTVYKGWIDDGQTPSETKMPVAVKRLKLEGFPGHDEWLTKLNYLGQLHHPNLMKLIGYNLEDELHWHLVTEFLPKNNLDFHLYGGRATRPLSWETRMKIAVGVAEGLSFLHDAESQVIYRYLDPTNIFLDDDFNAKLSIYVSTQAMDIYNDARLGYTAPESVEKKYGPGSFTTASDVYSYGVVLLVLLSGRPAFEKKMIGKIEIVRSASGMKSRRQLIQFMDHKLKYQYPQKTAFKVATLAIQCTLLPCFSRPNMSEVLRKLNKALRPPECRLQEH